MGSLAQSRGASDLVDDRRGHLPGTVGTGPQHPFYLPLAFQQLLPSPSSRVELRMKQVEQLLFVLPVARPARPPRAVDLSKLCFRREQLQQLVEGAVLGGLGRLDRRRIRLD